MTAIHLTFAPTPEAQKWRDLSPEKKQNELYARITLAVGIVISLIGVALAIYFCCNTTRLVYGADGQIVEKMNTVLSVAPSLFGGGGAIVLAIFLKTLDFERENTKLSCADLQKSEAKRWAVYLQLIQSNLEELSQEYAKGGLGPLVRCGMLTVEQGDCLRPLLNEYRRHQQTQTVVESREASFVKAFQENPTLCPEYQTAIEGIARLTIQWEALGGQIKATHESI